MLHQTLFILGNQLSIKRFLEPMKGDPSNIYCTKIVLQYSFSASVIKIVEKNL